MQANPENINSDQVRAFCSYLTILSRKHTKWHKLADEIKDQIIADMLNKLDHFDLGSISNVLLSLSRLMMRAKDRHFIEIQDALFNCIGRLLNDENYTVSWSEIAFILWPLASVGVKWRNIECLHATVFARLNILLNEASCSNEVALCLWSMASMGAKWKSLTGIHESILTNLQELFAKTAPGERAKGQSLANAIWALATMDAEWQQISSIAGAIFGCFQTLLTDPEQPLGAQETANTLWALACMGVKWDELCILSRDIFRRINKLMLKTTQGRTFNLQEIGNILWALSIMWADVPRDQVQRMFSYAETLDVLSSQNAITQLSIAYHMFNLQHHGCLVFNLLNACEAQLTNRSVVPENQQQLYLQLKNHLSDMTILLETPVHGYPVDILIGNIIIEIDGKCHNHSSKQLTDEHRDHLHAEYGYSVIRIQNLSLPQTARYAKALAHAIQSEDFTAVASLPRVTVKIPEKGVASVLPLVQPQIMVSASTMFARPAAHTMQFVKGLNPSAAEWRP